MADKHVVVRWGWISKKLCGTLVLSDGCYNSRLLDSVDMRVMWDLFLLFVRVLDTYDAFAAWTPHSSLEKDKSLNNSCVSPRIGSNIVFFTYPPLQSVRSGPWFPWIQKKYFQSLEAQTSKLLPVLACLHASGIQKIREFRHKSQSMYTFVIDRNNYNVNKNIQFAS